MKVYRLTTTDNQFNPFTQYREWLIEDMRLGHDTNSLLARIAKTSDELSVNENNEEIKQAMDEIIKYDFENIYTIVSQEVSEDELNND